MELREININWGEKLFFVVYKAKSKNTDSNFNSFLYRQFANLYEISDVFGRSYSILDKTKK